MGSCPVKGKITHKKDGRDKQEHFGDLDLRVGVAIAGGHAGADGPVRRTTTASLTRSVEPRPLHGRRRQNRHSILIKTEDGVCDADVDEDDEDDGDEKGDDGVNVLDDGVDVVIFGQLYACFVTFDLDDAHHDRCEEVEKDG